MRGADRAIGIPRTAVTLAQGRAKPIAWISACRVVATLHARSRIDTFQKWAIAIRCAKVTVSTIVVRHTRQAVPQGVLAKGGCRQPARNRRRPHSCSAHTRRYLHNTGCPDSDSQCRSGIDRTHPRTSTRDAFCRRQPHSPCCRGTQCTSPHSNRWDASDQGSRRCWHTARTHPPRRLVTHSAGRCIAACLVACPRTAYRFHNGCMFALWDRRRDWWCWSCSRRSADIARTRHSASRRGRPSNPS